MFLFSKRFPKEPIIFFVIFLGLLLLKVHGAGAGTLSCTVTTSCPAGTVIFRMHGTSNSHAEIATGTAYTNLVCCTGVSGLGNTCTGTYAKVLGLSGSTNAHVQQNAYSNYPYWACIQAPVGGSVSIGYQATNCTGFDTTIGSMSTTTNAHAGNSAAYAPIQICASASAAASITLTLSSSTVSLGNLAPGIAVTATTTATVAVTNAANGYMVRLNRESIVSTLASGSVLFPDYDPSWDPASNGGNGNAISALGNWFTFRVQQTDTTSNYSTAWWGANDTLGTAKHAGFATTSQTIMNCPTCTSGTTVTVIQYRADAPSSQAITGYTGNITFTALANP